MSGWRTNRETGEAFPTGENQSGIDEEIERIMNEPTPQPVNPNRCNCRIEGHGHPSGSVGDCGAGGSVLQISPTDVLCETCAYHILESEGLGENLPLPQSTEVGSDSSNFKKGDRKKCSKCGMVYAWGESESHWRTYHPEMD